MELWSSQESRNYSRYFKNEEFNRGIGFTNDEREEKEAYWRMKSSLKTAKICYPSEGWRDKGRPVLPDTTWKKMESRKESLTNGSWDHRRQCFRQSWNHEGNTEYRRQYQLRLEGRGQYSGLSLLPEGTCLTSSSIGLRQPVASDVDPCACSIRNGSKNKETHGRTEGICCSHAHHPAIPD